MLKFFRSLNLGNHLSESIHTWTIVPSMVSFHSITLIMNCQSVKNKKAELHTIIDSAKPDIILGNESWLTPDIKNSEIFPDSFDAIRKDRVDDAHGGVFIAFRRDLLCTETPELDTECEIVWCKLNILNWM